MDNINKVFGIRNDLITARNKTLPFCYVNIDICIDVLNFL